MLSVRTVIIRSKMKNKMIIVAFDNIIYVVFGIVIVVVIVNCEGSTISVQTLSGSRVLDMAVGTIIVKH